MLERMSANVSFALDNFDHEAARKNGERAMRRLNRMFGAISATNEAILRAKTEQDLYQRVCDAMVHSGKSIATMALLAEPGSIWLKPVAGTGEIARTDRAVRDSPSDPDKAYGRGCAATRSGRRSLASTTISSARRRAAVAAGGTRTGVVACVAVPLIKAGESVGVLMFFVGKLWAADEEIIALLARIAENVSFALENFERADEKAKPTSRRSGCRGCSRR